MFPGLPTNAFSDQIHDSQVASRRETKSASRLDAQRHLLKEKQMYHLDSMIVDQRALDRDLDLMRRQMIAQAEGERVSLASKVRLSFGSALIAVGERIRPTLTQSEPKFNG